MISVYRSCGPFRDTRWHLVLSALALVSCLLAWPQLSYSGWQTFTMRDGLGGTTASVILEDRRGNLWIASRLNDGTGGGVTRYDGLRWRAFTMADGLSDSTVRAICEDSNGVLWFGTATGGVTRYDGQSWKTFTVEDGLAGNSVGAILEDQAGYLWAAGVGGVARYDGSSWQKLEGMNSSVLCMTQDRAGNLWFDSTRYDGVTFQRFTTATLQTVRTVFEDSEGNLWFGGSGGLNRYDGSSWKTFYPNSVFTSIEQDRAGNLWFAGLGLYRYDGTTWRIYTASDGLVHSPNFVLEDRSGALWVGTQYGLQRFDQSTWKKFTTADGLVGDLINSVQEDAAGRLWAWCYDPVSKSTGLSIYDGTTWRPATSSDGPAGVALSRPLLRDRGGNLWFSASDSAGTCAVTRYDGSTWRTYTQDIDLLPEGCVNDIVEDQADNLWFATSVGIWRFDGQSWHTFTTADGLVGDDVRCVAEDRAGNLWFGTFNQGVMRYDGSAWKNFTVADGLVNNEVYDILGDHAGNVWVSSFSSVNGGVSRFDGTAWQVIPEADYSATSLMEDHEYNLWVGTRAGALRYDGEIWTTVSSSDGLGATIVHAFLEDRMGSVWIGTWRGLHRFEPDRVAPKTVFLDPPPSQMSSPDPRAVFVGAFGETDLEFSYRLDSDPWSPWSSVNTWSRDDLPDGPHTLEVRSRDMWNNVEETPAVTLFEIDATPPEPTLISPPFGGPVRGQVDIRGTTADARFEVSRIQMRRSGVTTWDSPEAVLLAESATPVTNSPLTTWDTSTLPDGAYEIRLMVRDALGLTGADQVTVVVDNHAPFFDQTAPAKVVAAIGGDIYTTNAEAHLYFPPHAFQQDALVMVVPLDAASVPSSPQEGAVKVLDGYELAWAGTLRKPARFTLRYTGTTSPPGTIAVYRSADGSVWEREGGTVNNAEQSVELAVTHPGRYALFADDGRGSGESSLSSLAFTPRVFSPTGGFSDRQVGISFRLGRPAAVTVKVFSRSGRLIREVLAGVPMSAGENLVRWDGTDRNGGIVTDDMYLVMVQALGHTETKLLAVVK